MTATKKLGICMDHASAHILEFTPNGIEESKVVSKSPHAEKTHGMDKGEKMMHNKEQQQQGDYYKKLGAVIKEYDEVILFGPTEAKVELFNILKEDTHFSKIKIDVQQTNKMTENQLHAFVKDYFK